MTPETKSPNDFTLVDVHHHMVPPGYLEALAGVGWDTSGFPEWTPELSLGIMDGFGVGKALLSVPSPGVWLGDDGEARSLAHTCNEYGASLVERHPHRFGVLAVLPFPDPEGALQELSYALDTLQLDGVILFSNVRGRYVGDPEFDPLMAELDRRKALVLLHPNPLPQDVENPPLYPWAEYPIDVARAWARLVLNDTLVAHPGIRWILGHAGGVVPFMAERLGKAHYAKVGGLRWGRILKDLFLKKHGGLELAKAVGYDTVGADNPITHAALRRLVGSERVLFGSDFPLASKERVGTSIRFLESAATQAPPSAAPLGGKVA